MKVYVTNYEKEIKDFIIYFDDIDYTTPYTNIRNMVEFYNLLYEINDFDIMLNISNDGSDPCIVLSKEVIKWLL